MTSKVIYPVVAVVGIAVASGAAWWYQTRGASGPKEITGSPVASAGAAVPPRAAGAGGGAPREAGVEVAQAQRARLQDDAQSVGTLRSRQAVMLRPEVPGRVKELGFGDGVQVRRGQLLVQLDDTLQRAEIKQAQAQVSIAQANFKRNQELVAQSFVTQRVLDESAANLQVAEAQLALSCARFTRMAIVAPFDGTVGMRVVNLGDFVKDGADLVNLEDTRSMYVDFRLPERFQSKLQLRQVVELQIDALPGRVFKATVEAIDPLLDVNGRSVGVRAVLPNTMGEPLRQQAAGGGARPGGGNGAGGAGAGAPAGAASRPAAADAAPRMAGAAAPPPGPRPAAGAGGGRPGGAGPARASAGPALAGARQPEPVAGCASVTAGAPEGASGGFSGGPLRPGMFARVTTIFSVKDAAIQVPEESIVPQGGRQFVIKVVDPATLPADGTNKAPVDAKLVSLRQEVKLGARQLGKVEITEGLAEGDTVVVAGHQRLQRDGTAVRIVDLSRPGGGGGQGGRQQAAGAAAGASAPAAAASGVAGSTGG